MGDTGHYTKAANSAANRSQLLAGAELDDMGAPTSSSQRERMLQTTDRATRTGVGIYVRTFHPPPSRLIPWRTGHFLLTTGRCWPVG